MSDLPQSPLTPQSSQDSQLDDQLNDWDISLLFVNGDWELIYFLTPQQVAGVEPDCLYNIVDILVGRDVDTTKINWVLDLFGPDAVKKIISEEYSLFDDLVNQEYKYGDLDRQKVLQKLKDMGCLDDSHERLIRRRVMALEDQLTRLFHLVRARPCQGSFVVSINV